MTVKPTSPHRTTHAGKSYGSITGEEATDNPELVDMQRRFWVSAALSLFVGAMLEMWAGGHFMGWFFAVRAARPGHAGRAGRFSCAVTNPSPIGT